MVLSSSLVIEWMMDVKQSIFGSRMDDGCKTKL